VVRNLVHFDTVWHLATSDNILVRPSRFKMAAMARPVLLHRPCQSVSLRWH